MGPTYGVPGDAICGAVRVRPLTPCGPELPVCRSPGAGGIHVHFCRPTSVGRNQLSARILFKIRRPMPALYCIEPVACLYNNSGPPVPAFHSILPLAKTLIITGLAWMWVQSRCTLSGPLQLTTGGPQNDNPAQPARATASMEFDLASRVHCVCRALDWP